MSVHYGQQSKVFAVSIKDRGAIPMAGFGGKAFWYSKEDGRFVTSSYYYDSYPKWVSDWNDQDHGARWKNSTWSLLRDEDTYLFKDADARPFERDLDGNQVARVVAEYYQKLPGVALAVSTEDLVAGNYNHSSIGDQLLRNYYPGRSGDVHIVQEPYWHMEVVGDAELVTLHGSPWSYDTYVPVVFAGNGLSPMRISRPIDPIDICATLSAYLGVKPPSKSQGIPLVEVLAGHRE